MTEDEKRLFSWLHLKALMMYFFAKGSFFLLEQGKYSGTFSTDEEVSTHVHSERQKIEKEIEEMLNGAWEKAKN